MYGEIVVFVLVGKTTRARELSEIRRDELSSAVYDGLGVCTDGETKEVGGYEYSYRS